MKPISKLTKKEIVWLAQNRCKKHSHTYLEHRNCLTTDIQNGDVPAGGPEIQRIGYLDIETNMCAFKADWGVITCYCILDEDTGEIYENHMKPAEFRSKNKDKRVVKSLIKHMAKFDRLVTFYGTMFDLKFIRTRAAIHGLEFFPFQKIKHTDVYYMVRSKFKLSRSTLENSCKVLLGKTHKTHFGSDLIDIVAGCPDAMKRTLEHCRYDVQDTQALYHYCKQFVGKKEGSI